VLARSQSAVSSVSAVSDLHPVPPPVDRSVLQGSIRAVLTGMLLGGVLSLCNVYTGLKIGWGTNMSITAALLAFGVWHLVGLLGVRPFGILENNVNQAGASAAASISSAGLVAPIPALAIITGEILSYPKVVAWVLVVSWVGVVAAALVRRQMLERESLAFPMGVATAETLREMYQRGGDALQRVLALLAGAAVAAVVKLAEVLFKLPKLPIPGELALTPKAAGVTLTAASLKNLTFAIEPSLLMMAIGTIVGKRVGWSMLVGSILAWLVLGPAALENGWASGGAPDKAWFSQMGPWLLWPGAAMMVTSALTSVALSVGSSFRSRGARGEAVEPPGYDLPRPVLLALGLGVSAATVACAMVIFELSAWAAIVAVALSVVLALVATRITGETGLTPVGAMGKVTQLTFGILTPGNVAANLMLANVTGGAASQASDLMNDLKTGRLLGAWPRYQMISQMLGVVSGALMGSLTYVILVPDPAAMLLTDEWPAPAVAQWKAVALVFKDGLSNLPPMSVTMLAIGAAVGVALALADRFAPRSVRPFVPSAGSLGLAFTLPAYTSLGIFLGAMIGEASDRIRPKWSQAFKIAIASGAIAGESLTGVAVSIQKILAG
jgi:putative OPT family oligopeptide transporter